MKKNDFLEHFEKIISKYENKINSNNIYFVDPLKDRDLIFQHYKKLSREDLFFRFNFFTNDQSINNYISMLIKNNSFVLAYIFNNEIIGLCETVPSSTKEQAEIGITVTPGYRKHNIGKNLILYSLYIANYFNYKVIRVDFLRKNEIVLQWVRSLELKYNSSYGEAYLTFPTFSGEIKDIKKYKRGENV
jgi:hypothetical protein